MSEANQNLEREVKLGAWPGFELPELDGFSKGVKTAKGAERVLDATYFDTPDLRLIRWGVTVRHRTGDDPPWTVKLPSEIAIPGVLSRLEIGFRGSRDRVPDAVSALVRVHRRSAQLEVVARLTTRRRHLAIHNGKGKVVANVDDDEVSVVADGRVTARFREVEAELAQGASVELLSTLVARLREAGAGAPDPTPKLVRALGPRALAPPDVVAVNLPGDPTIGDLARLSLASALLRIIHSDPVMRLDADVEGVHQMRVGARRLRSDLRTLGDAVDREWADELRSELAWMAGVLGPVRDADVLIVRLTRQGDRLALSDRPDTATLIERLRRERGKALELAVNELAGDRYGALIDCLVDAASNPRLTNSAKRPAVDVLPRTVGSAWRRLDKAVRAMDKESSGDSHRVRIFAKRARYAGEMAIPVVGKSAKQFSTKLARVQDVLGERQDAVVAESWLRQAGPILTRGQALVAGQLLSLQRDAFGADSDSEWKTSWGDVSQKRVTAWLR
mgnify:CR=1 FL=1